MASCNPVQYVWENGAWAIYHQPIRQISFDRVFMDRATTTERLLRFLKENSASSIQKHIIATGHPGCGKTIAWQALAWNMKRDVYFFSSPRELVDIALASVKPGSMIVAEEIVSTAGVEKLLENRDIIVYSTKVRRVYDAEDADSKIATFHLHFGYIKSSEIDRAIDTVLACRVLTSERRAFLMDYAAQSDLTPATLQQLWMELESTDRINSAQRMTQRAITNVCETLDATAFVFVASETVRPNPTLTEMFQKMFKD
jgi:hypothetical protein